MLVSSSADTNADQFQIRANYWRRLAISSKGHHTIRMLIVD